MTSSTNSSVDSDHPSVFRYFEQDGVVWGDYDGDTVAFGRFVGIRLGDELRMSFVHVLVQDGSAVTGSSASTIEATDGGLRLVERFTLAEAEHTSVCMEVSA